MLTIVFVLYNSTSITEVIGEKKKKENKHEISKNKRMLSIGSYSSFGIHKSHAFFCVYFYKVRKKNLKC